MIALADTVIAEIMNKNLCRSLKSIGAGKERIFVLAIDNVGWHRAKKLNFARGIHIEYLSAYSTELQPAESPWPLANEAVAIRSFQSGKDVDHGVENRSLQLSDQSHTICDYTNLHC